MTFVGEGVVVPKLFDEQAVSAMTILFAIGVFVIPVALLLHRLLIEVGRFKEVRKAQSYRDMQVHELFIETVDMMQKQICSC
jgi:hypothetical protein